MSDFIGSFDNQLSLLNFVRDAVLDLEHDNGIVSPSGRTGMTNVDLKSEVGVVYFDFMKVRFRVTDRWEVEEKGFGERGYGVGVASLLLRSFLGCVVSGLRRFGSIVSCVVGRISFPGWKGRCL